MLIPFLISFIYFFAKAYKSKENYWVFGILGGAAAGFLTMIFTWMLKIAIYREGGLGIDRSTATVIGVVLIIISVLIVDRYSGLKWNVLTNDKPNEDNQDSDILTEEDLEKLNADNICKDIDNISQEK